MQRLVCQFHPGTFASIPLTSIPRYFLRAQSSMLAISSCRPSSTCFWHTRADGWMWWGGLQHCGLFHTPDPFRSAEQQRTIHNDA